MRTKPSMRFWLWGLLFLISVVPQIILAPFLSILNLLFLVALWIVLCAVALLGSRLATTSIAFIWAIAMAIPPAPNYVWFSNTGSLYFHFIGWRGVAYAAYSTAFFFVFYLILFELAAAFGRRPATPAADVAPS